MDCPLSSYISAVSVQQELPVCFLSHSHITESSSSVSSALSSTSADSQRNIPLFNPYRGFTVFYVHSFGASSSLGSFKNMRIK